MISSYTMNPIGEDSSKTLLKGFSCCVSMSLYESERRSYRLRVVDDPNEVQTERELLWTGIRRIAVTPNDEEDLDDDCMDSVLGIHERLEDCLVSVFVQTDKYAIEFQSERSVEVNTFKHSKPVEPTG